jgi:hypothetical protein
MGSHGRSTSLNTPNSGSFGKAELQRMQNQAEFGKYAETDDEDYDDVFGKSNGSSECVWRFWKAVNADWTGWL